MCGTVAILQQPSKLLDQPRAVVGTSVILAQDRTGTEVMHLGARGTTVDFGENKARSVYFGKYAVILLVGGSVLTAAWLLAAVWRRATNNDFEPESVSQAVASHPMRLSPLIAGDNRANGGEIVYLTRVLLKPGPRPKLFFLAGSQGTEILTVAETAHVLATPGVMVDVKGTIRNTPSIGALRKQWNLNPTDAKLVSQIPIYIESNFIRESDD